MRDLLLPGANVPVGSYAMAARTDDLLSLLVTGG
jgi:hypothetical protein